MIRLVVVDDHPVVRGGLRDTFAGAEDVVVVGEAGDGAEGVERARALAADVVLMDLRMPGMDGVAATAALRAQVPDARVLVLTTFDGESDVLPAIEAGAIGYLLKDALPDDLLRAVRAAARGEPVLAPSATQHLMGQVRRPGAGTLTDRRGRCCSSSRTAARTGRPRRRCSSVRRASRPTSSTSTTSSACATAPPRWPRATAAAS